MSRHCVGSFLCHGLFHWKALSLAQKRAEVHVPFMAVIKLEERDMAIFKGAGVAIVTPMHADGSVNFEKLEETIDYQIENGTDSIVICGTTGESSTLSEEEHIECIRTAISRTAGRIPVIAGTGSNSTETAIYLTKEAEEAGADGALVVTPYYNKATQKGLVAQIGRAHV